GERGRTRPIAKRVQAGPTAERGPFNAQIPVGAMIEVPAAALLARRLAQEVDFFSLGTNDLVQYLLAADREDESVAPAYQPSHPAVLQLIQSLAEAARSARRELTVCGEMAGDPRHTALLVGLGPRPSIRAPGRRLAGEDGR